VTTRDTGLTNRARAGMLAGMAALVLLAALAAAVVIGRRPPSAAPATGGAAASQPLAALAVTRFRCPMHHDVTSTDPKARCPKCNMFINEPIPTAAPPAPPVAAPPALGGIPVATPVGDERHQLIGVRRATVERRDLVGDVTAAAVVAPDESRVAHVHTKLTGWITRLLVTQTGESVRRGEPLLAIYSEELYRAQEEYLTLRRTVVGITDDAARAELVAATRRRLQLLDMPGAEIDAIEKSGVPRRDVVLRSPLAGVVLARHVSEGSYVQPGSDLFVVGDLTRLWALADVPAPEAESIHAGMKAPVSFTAYPGEVREARVAYVYPSLAADTRTIRVRLELGNQDLQLKPGMFGEVRLRVSLPRALVVPAEAVLETSRERYSFVVNASGAFEPRLVVVGRRVGTEVQILGGLAAGEEVVASASFLVDSESGLRAAIRAMRRPRGSTPLAGPSMAPPVPDAVAADPRAGHGR
jgi:membrane fusion protein, copper/silver efflux system